MRSSQRRKQYIIFDTSVITARAVALVVRAAYFADYTHQADIRLKSTRSLDAEIYNSHRKYALRLERKRLAPKNPDPLTVHDATAGFTKYVNSSPENTIDKQIRMAMVPSLCALYRRDRREFYRVFDDEIEIMIPELDIPLWLNEKKYFTRAYSFCTWQRVFQETCRNLKLHKDLADQSLLEWYASHLASEPDTDVILVTTDVLLVERMKALYLRHTSDCKLQKFEHFDLHGFVEHIKEEVEAWIEKISPDDAAGLEDIMSDIDLCYDMIMERAKPDHNALKYENNILSSFGR